MSIRMWTGRIRRTYIGKIGGVKMKGLNIANLKKEKNLITVSSKDALKDVTPINWSKEVLERKRNVCIKLDVCNEGGKAMVMQMSNYRKESPAIEISLVDMLFDRSKREYIYNKYDKNYFSTQEEDEIFQDMMGVGFDDID